MFVTFATSTYGRRNGPVWIAANNCSKIISMIAI